MHQIQLSDQLYEEVLQRASEAGYPSVDEYVANVLQDDSYVADDKMDDFFTSERLAIIDRSVAQADAGNVFTSEQVDEYFERKQRE